MANDSSLLPTTASAPGQATLYTAAQTVAIAGATGPGVVTAGGGSITTTDIEFDYSAHLDRIVTALEQMSLSMAFIADKIDNLSDKVTVLADQVTRESPKVLQTIGNLNETNIIRLDGPLLIDPSGYFVQSEGIVPNTFVVSYYSEGGHYYLKINRDNSYFKVINGEPRVVSKSADALPITLIPPVVMTASNISKIVDADSENLKIISPWEWLGISSIVKLYDEKGVDYNVLKARVDSIPKSI